MRSPDEVKLRILVKTATHNALCRGLYAAIRGKKLRVVSRFFDFTLWVD